MEKPNLCAIQPVTDINRSVEERITPLIDLHEAAKLLNVNERTVSRMCCDGQIKAVKVRSMWRVNRAALYEFMGMA